jgi:hypothetical protein
VSHPTFRQLWDDLLDDERVSLAATAFYGHLARESFRARRRGRISGDGFVELPPIDELARGARISERTARTYLDELRQAGWIETRRESLRRPLAYLIHTPESGKICRTRDAPSTAESAGPRPEKSTAPRARSSSSRRSKSREGRALRALPPGVVWLPGGRDGDGFQRSLDALIDACNVPRRNGRRMAQARDALDDIRHFVYADHFGDDKPPDVYTAADAEAYERTVITRIHARAEAYHAFFMNDVLLTPDALAKWWHDVDPNGNYDAP